MTTLDCDALAGRLEAYLDNRLSRVEAAAVEAHLKNCPECEESVHYERAIAGLVDFVQLTPDPGILKARSGQPDEQPEETPFAFEKLNAAPWWIVSATLHVLIIALASLVSMSFTPPANDDTVVMVTELAPRTELKDLQKEKQKAELQDVLAKVETPPTDVNSREASDIVVPPDILARAELGDHFETDNSRPDSHSAYGNEDSRSFHSIQGNADAPGGGGMGGVGMDDLIGVGGAASAGSGGGFGGGNGTGVGVQSGGGKGSFGNRNGGGRKLMVKRNGGSKATESAVDSALRWLAYHQEPDGHWDCVKYGGGADWNNVNGGHHYDTAMTGLALLAFLGAGHTEKVGEWKDNVQRAVAWLKSAQDEQDGVKKGILAGHGYEQAILTMALSEAAGMANIPDTVAAAQKAVDYCVDLHQENGSAWRYIKHEAPDISVTGWFVMALKSAKVAGLKVNPKAFEGAMNFLDKVETRQPQAQGSDSGYGPVLTYRYRPNEETQPAQTTAIGVLCRQFMGFKKDDLQSSVEWFVNKGGTGKPNGLYFCYYGTLSTFQEGGDVWKRWNEAMKPALLDSQDKNGDNEGSWGSNGDPFFPWWGRVGSTALATLSLEVYYRYQRLTR